MDDIVEIVEADKDELEILEEYRASGRLAPDFFPLITYDLIQEGYPTPNRGIMVARAWSGSDAEGRLLSGRGEFCKVEDVKRLLDESAAALSREREAGRRLAEAARKVLAKLDHPELSVTALDAEELRAAKDALTG